MELLLVFCFALAHAIQGAATQAWTDGKAGARTAGARAVTVANIRAAKIRKSGPPLARGALGFIDATWMLIRGLCWVGKGAGKAIWTGGRAGWQKGWEKGRSRGREQAERRNCQECGHGPHGPGDLYGCRDECPCRVEGCQCGPESEWNHGDGDPAPTWGNYITGRCPRCQHLPKASEAETDGCGCENLDWSCPCARRNSDRPPPPVPDPEVADDIEPSDRPPVSLTKPPAGGDGTAASDDPTSPEPTNPTPTSPDPIDLPEENPMPVTTSEPVGYAGTCRALEEIGAAATTYLDTAAQARSEAEELRRMAEQMRANMSARDMDPSSLAAVSQLMEQAARLEAAADELASAADGTRAASATALDAVQTHAAVAEAVQSHEHAADKEFYTEGR